jgi:hypothetical protein
VGIFSKIGRQQRKKDLVSLPIPKEVVPITDEEAPMSRTASSYSHQGPTHVPTGDSDLAEGESSPRPRKRGSTNGSKQRRRRASTKKGSEGSNFQTQQSPGQLDPIATVSPMGSDFGDESSADDGHFFSRKLKPKRKAMAKNNSSAENITALPGSKELRRSPHLRPATKDNIDIPYDFRLYSNSRLGTPDPESALNQPSLRPWTPPKKKRSLLSRSGSMTKPPHLAELPARNSKRSSKREPPLREEDMRSMAVVSPRPHTSGVLDKGILEREDKQIREGLNKRFGRPQSTISLPRMEVNTRPSTRMSSMGGTRPPSASGIKSRSYRISVLDVVSPRPLIKVQENAPESFWGDDGISGTRPETALTKLTFGDVSRLRSRELGKERTKHRKIDDLADDMDASDIRMAMERDRRRKERKQEKEAEKLKRRLERRAEKDEADEDGNVVERVLKPESATAAAERERTREKQRSKSKRSRKDSKEPVPVGDSKRKLDEKSLPPLPPPVPPKELTVDYASKSKSTSRLSHRSSFPYRHDPDEENPEEDENPFADPKPAADAEEPKADEDGGKDDESHTSSPIQPMFPLQALPPLADRKGADRSGRPPNMSLGPLLASSAAASEMFAAPESNSFTALPPVPSPDQKSKRRGSLILGLFRRGGPKDPLEQKDEEKEKTKEVEKESKRERRRSRAKSLIGSFGGKKTPEPLPESKHDSVESQNAGASTSVSAYASSSLGRMFGSKSKAKTPMTHTLGTSSLGTQPRETRPPRLVSDDESIPKPLVRSTSGPQTPIKPPTPLRSHSIFKEQLDESSPGDLSTLPGPYSTRPLGSDKDVTTPLAPSGPLSSLGLLAGPSVSPYGARVSSFTGGNDDETPKRRTVQTPNAGEMASVDTEGSWLTGKPIKPRPSSRGSGRILEEAGESSKAATGGLQVAHLGLPANRSHSLLRAPSTSALTDNTSRDDFFDASSFVHASHDEDSDHPDESNVITPKGPKAQSRVASYMKEMAASPEQPSMSEIGSDEGDHHAWEQDQRRRESAQMKIYSPTPEKKPEVRPGVSLKSSEGLLKETLGYGKELPPVPTEETET